MGCWRSGDGDFHVVDGVQFNGDKKIGLVGLVTTESTRKIMRITPTSWNVYQGKCVQHPRVSRCQLPSLATTWLFRRCSSTSQDTSPPCSFVRSSCTGALLAEGMNEMEFTEVESNMNDCITGESVAALVLHGGPH
jgi:hypothetical protein